jgi:hypothetical protein
LGIKGKIAAIRLSPTDHATWEAKAKRIMHSVLAPSERQSIQTIHFGEGENGDTYLPRLSPRHKSLALYFVVEALLLLPLLSKTYTGSSSRAGFLAGAEAVAAWELPAGRRDSAERVTGSDGTARRGAAAFLVLVVVVVLGGGMLIVAGARGERLEQHSRFVCLGALFCGCCWRIEVLETQCFYYVRPKS